MMKFVSGKKTVAVLLTVLLTFHVFHLYLGWKNSKIQIVEAVYEVPAALYVGQLGAGKQLEETLTSRLKLDNQLAEGFRPSIWDNKGEVHASFALHLPAPEQTLGRLGGDIEQVFRGASASSVPSPEAKVRLLSWGTHVNPGIKPLDLLSLAALIGALWLWLRGGENAR